MRAFFFGAGSSFGTLEHDKVCPPLAKDFGCYLSKQPGFPRKYPNLELASSHLSHDLSRIGLEDLWTCLDYYAKLSGFNGALPTHDWLWPAVKELKEQALLWLYGRRCDDAANSLPDSDGYTLGELVKNQIKNGDVVISFNYDTLIERLARCFDVPLRHCSGEPHGYVKFLKPHGSASWPLNGLTSVLNRVTDGDPLVDSLTEDMGNEPLMLGAVPIKSELLREVQKCHTPGEVVFQVIMHQWRGVVEAVRDADELIVVGYGFPKEDQYGRFLFQEGVRMRSCPFKKIEYYNRRAESGASLLEIFAREDTEIVWKGPVRGAPME